MCTPASAAEESACAKQIHHDAGASAPIASRLDGPGPDTLLSFYQTARSNGNFENGIEQALARVLVDPRFVFRFEREPANRERRRRLSRQRSGTGLAPVVLPVEQHPGR